MAEKGMSEGRHLQVADDESITWINHRTLLAINVDSEATQVFPRRISLRGPQPTQEWLDTKSWQCDLRDCLTKEALALLHDQTYSVIPKQLVCELLLPYSR